MRIAFHLFLSIFAFYSGASAQNIPSPAPKPDGGRNSTILHVDFRKLVSRADLSYDQPASRSEEGLPTGNGRTGSLVWSSRGKIHHLGIDEGTLGSIYVWSRNLISNRLFLTNCS